VRTSEIDHADWNFDGLLGYVSRQRFRLAVELLPASPLRDVLEIGYGSGIFIPELAARAERVAGIDVHDRAASVSVALAKIGAVADLTTGRSEALPYADASFDAVVVVSALEFVADLEATLGEMMRVLRPRGRAVVVTPGDHPLLDLALRVATGASASSDFGDRRGRIVKALAAHARVVAHATFPRWSPLPIYRAFALERASASTP
jgi:SAM-dependent methyltransferase